VKKFFRHSHFSSSPRVACRVPCPPAVSSCRLTCPCRLLVSPDVSLSSPRVACRLLVSPVVSSCRLSSPRVACRLLVSPVVSSCPMPPVVSLCRLLYVPPVYLTSPSVACRRLLVSHASINISGYKKI